MDNYAQIYSLLGLASGVLIIIDAGYLILAVKPSSPTEWSFQWGKLQFHISTRVSGLVLAVVGMLVIWITRP